MDRRHLCVVNSHRQGKGPAACVWSSNTKPMQSACKSRAHTGGVYNLKAFYEENGREGGDGRLKRSGEIYEWRKKYGECRNEPAYGNWACSIVFLLFCVYSVIAQTSAIDGKWEQCLWNGSC